MTLQQMIADLQAEALPNIPDDILQTMQRATAQLLAAGLAGHAVKAGEQAPDFTLPNTRGEPVALQGLLARGPVVVNFYRGSWCPYCVLELKALQDALPRIDALGASLVAISPNVVEKSAAYVAENPFDFDILSDRDNQVAKTYGLVFKLAEELRPIYKMWGAHLPDFDGNDRYELPMPATYVVRADGSIAAAFVDEDYTRRMEPAAIIESLERG